MDLDLEITFINKCVIKNKRQRYIGFISNPKRRSTFLKMLYHGRDIDKSKFMKVDSGLEMLLTKRLAMMPVDVSGYIISVDRSIDGQMMSARSAINKLNAYTEGTLLIFGKCELVYYVGEAPHNEYISV
ncbi:hypothetical protein [Hymenobacter fodinae]|uniref:Uncharacterized protein n=1 Tax=Hymenobacter fodinae TaxID=2510796 RepID=A0A4Z0P862_9BACT|nr:hypothetical protein [Hymenobacter fodinae]TGE07577.1 hypothetical protein EU556_07425 [Hymenobacter fodinae]